VPAGGRNDTASKENLGSSFTNLQQGRDEINPQI
jgi:hypothetical protein